MIRVGAARHKSNGAARHKSNGAARHKSNGVSRVFPGEGSGYGVCRRDRFQNMRDGSVYFL